MHIGVIVTWTLIGGVIASLADRLLAFPDRGRPTIAFFLGATAAASVALELEDAVIREFWVDHPYSASALSGALLLLIAAFLVDEAIKARARARWKRVADRAAEELAVAIREFRDLLEPKEAGSAVSEREWLGELVRRATVQMSDVNTLPWNVAAVQQATAATRATALRWLALTPADDDLAALMAEALLVADAADYLCSVRFVDNLVPEQSRDLELDWYEVTTAAVIRLLNALPSGSFPRSTGDEWAWRREYVADREFRALLRAESMPTIRILVPGLRRWGLFVPARKPNEVSGPGIIQPDLRYVTRRFVGLFWQLVAGAVTLAILISLPPWASLHHSRIEAWTLLPVPLRVSMVALAAAPFICVAVLAVGRLYAADPPSKRVVAPLVNLGYTAWGLSLVCAASLVWAAAGIDGWLRHATLRFGGFAAFSALIYLTVTLFRLGLAAADLAQDDSLGA